MAGEKAVSEKEEGTKARHAAYAIINYTLLGVFSAMAIYHALHGMKWAPV